MTCQRTSFAIKKSSEWRKWLRARRTGSNTRASRTTSFAETESSSADAAAIGVARSPRISPCARPPSYSKSMNHTQPSTSPRRILVPSTSVHTDLEQTKCVNFTKQKKTSKLRHLKIAFKSSLLRFSLSLRSVPLL